MSDRRLSGNRITIRLRSWFSLGSGPLSGSALDPQGRRLVQTEEGTRVADLIQSLGLLGSGTPLDDVFIFVHINDRPVTLDQRLEDGDILDLHLPAMGG